MLPAWKDSPIKAASRDSVVRAKIMSSSGTTAERDGGRGIVLMDHNDGDKKNDEIYKRILSSASAMFDDDDDNSPAPLRRSRTAVNKQVTAVTIDALQAQRSSEISYNDTNGDIPFRTRVTFTDPVEQDPSVLRFGPPQAPPARTPTAPALLPLSQGMDTNISTGDTEDVHTPSRGPHVDATASTSAADTSMEYQFSRSILSHEPMSISPERANTYNSRVLAAPLRAEMKTKTNNDEELSYDISFQDDFHFLQVGHPQLHHNSDNNNNNINDFAGDNDDFSNLSGNGYVNLEQDRMAWSRYAEDEELMKYTAFLIQLNEEFDQDIPDFSTKKANVNVVNSLSIAEDIERSLKEHLRIPLATLQMNVLNTVR